MSVWRRNLVIPDKSEKPRTVTLRHYTPQCVIQSTCEAAVRQNFVFGTDSANAKFNQCKKQTSLTIRENTSECSFCQKLGHETGLGNTDIFDAEGQPFEGITEAELTQDPAAKGLWTAGQPLGQLFADNTYTSPFNTIRCVTIKCQIHRLTKLGGSRPRQKTLKKIIGKVN